jgi:hypothetical protein
MAARPRCTKEDVEAGSAGPLTCFIAANLSGASPRAILPDPMHDMV